MGFFLKANLKIFKAMIKMIFNNIFLKNIEMNKKLVAIIQARFNSSRLPGKVLKL